MTIYVSIAENSFMPNIGKGRKRAFSVTLFTGRHSEYYPIKKHFLFQK